MVVYELTDSEVDAMFRALADATRRDIVDRVLHENASVSRLAERYDMSFAAVQKHVAVLQAAGLVTKSRQGREQIVSGNLASIHHIQKLLSHFEAVWKQRAVQMADVLRDDATAEAPPSPMSSRARVDIPHD
ncbi:helix-turn-helix transcriptional regulator [Salinibacterium sp. NK8237]|uniref:ArsR/SmtB family transcription factor n=1 Tax=Salinibacterium sp. NK8237 TaxID=2792038 RepID=UPI0018CF586D|nr:metalloregulator ArsR/SmtB family transcription factor [Salinibacterium sp. NK8237]MBH0128854.1 winged helix-turn-helix transcriptional regulator [Salinibacterium sp. NK8237]